MKSGILNVHFHLRLLLATGNSEASRFFWLGQRTNMPTQQPRAINKNNRSSRETVRLLSVWHSQEFPSVYAIQSQASSEECSGFSFFRILFPINPRKADSYDWSRGGSSAWKEKSHGCPGAECCFCLLKCDGGQTVQRPFTAMHQRLLKASFVSFAFYLERTGGASCWLRSAIRLSLGINL